MTFSQWWFGGIACQIRCIFSPDGINPVWNEIARMRIICSGIKEWHRQFQPVLEQRI